MTQEARRSASNERLISAAIQLISERGSTGMSLADVGLAAGFSRGLPGERFGSKLGLLQATVRFLREWLQARVAAEVNGRVGLDAVLTRIDCHLQAAADEPGYHRALYHLVLDSTWTEPGLADSIAELEQAHRSGFMEHLREGQEREEIDPSIDVAQQAMLIVGAMRGVIIQAVVSGKPRLLGTIQDEMRRMFLLTLSAHDPAARTSRRPATPSPARKRSTRARRVGG